MSVKLQDDDILDVCRAIKDIADKLDKSAAQLEEQHKGDDKFFSHRHAKNGPYMERLLGAQQRQRAFYNQLWRDIRDGRYPGKSPAK